MMVARTLLQVAIVVGERRSILPFAPIGDRDIAD
jgi:hypothetical protein